MDNAAREYLWAQIQPFFVALEHKIHAQFQGPIFTNIDMYHNDSFPFYGCIELGKTKDSYHLVVAADTSQKPEGLELDGCITHNHNPFSVDGPSYLFTATNPMSEALLDAWVAEFTLFIDHYTDQIKPIIESMEI
ncbi:MAG: hypothetical protein LCH85_16375 [Chloroflexi bacterium]|nr:hypothetical protein [Chloroflexota bacterium]